MVHVTYFLIKYPTFNSCGIILHNPSMSQCEKIFLSMTKYFLSRSQEYGFSLKVIIFIQL